jgi:hypothetical protein
VNPFDVTSGLPRVISFGADKRAELQALVERLAAPIKNKNVRARFTGIAALQAA